MPAGAKIKVLVLMGGPSPEYEVSLKTAKNVIQALDSRKYSVAKLLIPKSGGLPKFPKTDVAFIAMHGTYGEDGTIQAILEALKIPYTGSGVLASALGMDKPRAGAIFREAGLVLPKFEIITKAYLTHPECVKFTHSGCVRIFRGRSALKLPLVVKPANHGSSVGVSICRNKKELARGIRKALKFSPRVIIQKLIKGREFTCGALEDMNGKLTPLPPTEIIPQKGKFYDYKSKYDEKGSQHVVPPKNLSIKIIQEIQKAACRAHQAIGCSGMSRSDFILGEDGRLYILEINTIPGMTKTSLLPEAAKAAGIEFSEILDRLIARALKKN